VIDPEPETVPPVTLTAPAEIDPLTAKLPELTFNPPAVMVVVPELVKFPPATVIPPELTVVLAKVTFPEFKVIPAVAVRSLETFTLPAPFATTVVALIAPPEMATSVELGLLKLTRLGLTPALSTMTVAVLVKAVLSPVLNAADTPPGTVFHGV
jgi:hypothetical protein